MVSFRPVLCCFFAAALSAAPALATKTHHATSPSHTGGVHKTVSKSRSRSKAHSVARSHKLHGQQAIDPERVTQIQQALVREHYLSQEPNGQWDAATQAAMQKYQADQGWQTRLMPDSRALVKLGLGPDYSSAINAKDIASAPQATPASSIPVSQAAGFASASGVNQ
jgi:peptidoglycan hydrolase-like protein with peptidoglycan-binding domain